jgi:hypothetical protein
MPGSVAGTQGSRFSVYGGRKILHNIFLKMNKLIDINSQMCLLCHIIFYRMQEVYAESLREREGSGETPRGKGSLKKNW